MNATYSIIKPTFEIRFTAELSECCPAFFSDQWKLTNNHQGGVTIKNPLACRNSYPYAIPLQCSLSELTASYAEQGQDNPSKAAYDSLQAQLKRDLEASEYFITGAIFDLEGNEVINSVAMGYAFDYSFLDKESLEEALKRNIVDSDCETQMIEAVEEFKKRISKI
ncbi:hypothetical protein [Salmonella phage vB_SenM_SB18]|uniref:Uncharacterized protein n=4 Tax=Caudoviricetes TaxID=2731619 RepID=A0A6B9RIE1_9CAUD|nr:hypothetical protein SUNLIREN_17 [Erwinia phage SunLIRen]AYD79622.1 hypothetical protein LINGLNFE_00140 [Enterobacter phage phi63_307]QHI00563.1 hypothetical protein [Salmonella phage vB_SenM_SB18]UFD98338.1 hypothetical protein SPARTY_15 [Hafnia phage vB_HalM_SPARTY]UXD79819.1 hypothetical protein 4Roscha1_00129 [Erwinia phage Roscha1]WJN64431.1 hypothetical protein Erwinia_phage_Panisse_00104 [Erwinia phage Panisse]